jgi:nickel/cobalt transporter (NiCoT) family protein
MQDGQRPVTVGFYFSLGHSTIAVVASLIAYATASMLLQQQLDAVREIGNIVGNSISAFFLLAIALFGLGLDTATEVAILGISAAAG